jgi:hypothetical protein
MTKNNYRIWDTQDHFFRKSVYETAKDCYLFIAQMGYATAFNCYGDELNFDDERFVIQQHTGSTDSAQNPIYEGDVVLWHAEDHFEGGYSYKKMVVGWNQRCMQFRLFEFPNQVGKAAGETFWAEDVRVIGHVFDYENEECRYHLDESVKNLRK